MNAREKLLAELGKQVIDYLEKTGDCVFCWIDDEGKHHPECPVPEVTRKLAMLDESESI